MEKAEGAKKATKTRGTQVTITKFRGFEVLITKNEKAFHTRRCHYVNLADQTGVVKCNKCITCAKGDEKSDAESEVEEDTE